LRAAGILAIAVLIAAGRAHGADTDAPPAPRVEARSADLLAVGVVHGDKMSVRVSRSADNAPVRDAAISVVLRGNTYAAVAEADGSYSFEARDLTLPGAAVVEFQVTQAAAHESLKGTLDVAGAAGRSDGQSNARQLWWWVLNFAVCFGILWLISRRRKAAKD
jgi:hypothetical protein